jgi:thiosulfate dehydrogenase [quinone] large subunit
MITDHGTSIRVTADRARPVPSSAPSARPAVRYASAALRIVLGFTFFWAFIDKLFGFGYATPSAKSWINGGSPTKGFLSSSEGPFASLWHNLAGTGFANWAFMLGLLGIGTALLLGIGQRLATGAGVLMYLLMWSVVLPPANNPVVDDHIIGALALVLLLAVGAGDTFGFGRWWKAQPVVQDNSWLK